MDKNQSNKINVSLLTTFLFISIYSFFLQISFFQNPLIYGAGLYSENYNDQYLPGTGNICNGPSQCIESICKHSFLENATVVALGLNYRFDFPNANCPISLFSTIDVIMDNLPTMAVSLCLIIIASIITIVIWIETIHFLVIRYNIKRNYWNYLDPEEYYSFVFKYPTKFLFIILFAFDITNQILIVQNFQEPRNFVFIFDLVQKILFMLIAESIFYYLILEDLQLTWSSQHLQFYACSLVCKEFYQLWNPENVLKIFQINYTFSEDEKGRSKKYIQALNIISFFNHLSPMHIQFYKQVPTFQKWRPNFVNEFFINVAHKWYTNYGVHYEIADFSFDPISIESQQWNSLPNISILATMYIIKKTQIAMIEFINEPSYFSTIPNKSDYNGDRIDFNLILQLIPKRFLSFYIDSLSRKAYELFLLNKHKF